MKVDWKISILISFGNNKNLLMNGFISWHMQIKEYFNTNYVMTYNILCVRQRKIKTGYFDKLYDQFSQFQIKRFYVEIKSIFVIQEMVKENSIKLFKSI